MKALKYIAVSITLLLPRFVYAQLPSDSGRAITQQELVRMSGRFLGTRYKLLHNQDSIPPLMKRRITEQLFEVFSRSGKLAARKLVVVDTVERQKSYARINASGFRSEETECTYMMLCELTTNLQVRLLFRACFTSKGELMFKHTLEDIAAQSARLIPAATAATIAARDTIGPMNGVCDRVLLYHAASRSIVWVVTEQPGDPDAGQHMTVVNATTGDILQRNKINLPDRLDIPVLPLGYVKPLNQMVPFREGKLWGYADSTRTMIIPLRYQSAGFFRKIKMGEKIFCFAIVQLNQKYGLINEKGSGLTECIYDSIYKDYATGLFILKKGATEISYPDNKIFLSRPSGELVFFEKTMTGILNPHGYYESAKTIQVNKQGDQQYQVIRTISTEGEMESRSDTLRIQAIELKQTPLRDDIFLVKTQTGWGLISFYSKENVPSEYDTLTVLNYFTVAAKKKDNWALLYLRSQYKTAFEYQEVLANVGMNYIIKQNGSWGIKTDSLQVLLTKEPITRYDWIEGDISMAKVWGLDGQLLGYADMNGTIYWK